MKHDRLSKKLLETFFADFLRLIAPDAARRLRLGEPSFLDKELCTDWPSGARPGSWSRAELKVECLRRVRAWEDTGHRKEAKRCWSIGSRAMYN